MRLAIDTGGTFTDCVYFADGRLRVLKIPSTPAEPSQAVLRAVKEASSGISSEVRHGTTVGTNALLERKGARVAFVTTAGFEDTIAIGRQARPKLFDLFFQKEPALAPADRRFGVPERTASDGAILREPSPEELAELLTQISATNPEAIAISLLFSFVNPTNERAVAAALKDVGVPLSVSHEILPEFREYERGSTILINAYLSPKMQGYLEQLETALRGERSTLHVMQSSGGILPAAMAAKEPVRTILSGPAGGVVGAMAVARAAGIERILTFDMGGTSTDVALINIATGPRMSNESQILGMPIAVPMLDIHTVGAGGGSLAAFDRGGALKVGPESAGADPGPICYGRGSQPTVTDANLILGRVDQDLFLDGGIRLNLERTRAAFAQFEGKMTSPETLAEGIIQVANSHMERALRRISIEQGHDPRDFVLLSFGGAGPLHACELARALRIPRVLVPRWPGALSAYGILVSDVVRDYSRTVMLRPADPALTQHFAALEANSSVEMRAEGLIGVAERSFDMRYTGQGYELPVRWNTDFVEQFHCLHEQRYGYADRQRPVEVVNVRVRMTARTEPLPTTYVEKGAGDPARAIVKTKQIFYAGCWQEARVYSRSQLRSGDQLDGPAVVVEYSATTFVPPDARLTVDDLGNVAIEV
jgi:N-methylhydantoinase A